MKRMVESRRIVRALSLALSLALPGAGRVHATNDQTVVINEIGVVPLSGGEKFLEILNRGTTLLDTTNWWLCDHPASSYTRLLQVPQQSGPPLSPGIMVAPGDFLVIRIHSQFPPPNGDYATRPNNSGTTTHILRLFIPAPAIPSLLRGDNGNYSIWDHSPPGDPDFPYFAAAQFMRDFIAWGPGGLHSSLQRGCVASNPIASLWPLPVSGDCNTATPVPAFVALNSALFPPASALSMNYNGRLANDPTDYFVAPATEGEANVMPGDLNGDFQMNQADYDLFVGCLGQPATNPSCRAADLDGSGNVDCGDWPLFSNDWQKYSQQPVPPQPPACVVCTRGDVNNDGLLDGQDIAGFVAVIVGADTDPRHRCAADADADGQIGDGDLSTFVGLLLGSE